MTCAREGGEHLFKICGIFKLVMDFSEKGSRMGADGEWLVQNGCVESSTFASSPSCSSAAPVRVIMGNAVMVNLLLPLTPVQKCSGEGRGFRRGKVSSRQGASQRQCSSRNGFGRGALRAGPNSVGPCQ